MTRRSEIFNGAGHEFQRMIAQAAVSLPAPPVDVVTFDGFRFPKTAIVQHAYLFDLAYRARRGDESAIAVLSTSSWNIRDLDNGNYWPMAESTELVLSADERAKIEQYGARVRLTPDNPRVTSGGD